MNEPATDQDREDREVFLDWTKVAPQYNPRTGPAGGRGRIIALLALVMVIAAAGGWLVFGPNTPHTGAAQKTRAGAGSNTGQAPAGLTSNVTVHHGTTVVVHDRVSLSTPTTQVTVFIPRRNHQRKTKPFDPLATITSITSAKGSAGQATNPVFGPGDTETLVFTDPVRVFTVTYHVDNAVYEIPGSNGIGLALATPVEVEDQAIQEDASRVINVNGPRILTMLCIVQHQKSAPCGTHKNLSWTVTLIGPDSGDIAARVDLPD